MVVFGQQFRRSPHPPGNHVEDRTGNVRGRFLGNKGDAQTLTSGDLPAVGDQIPVQQLQQGGFARAVPSQETEAVSFFNLQADPVQEVRSAKCEMYVP